MSTTAGADDKQNAQELLREFLLAVQREKEFLDDVIARFTQQLNASRGADSLAALFSRVHPHLEPLFLIWHDMSSGTTTSRWEDRTSIALHMEAFSLLMEHLVEHDQAAAEIVAFRVIRERSSCLEKQLTWSDKPVIVCRTLQLMTSIARVNGSVVRELVRVFNFDSAIFQKLAMRRFKEEKMPQDDEKETNEFDGEESESDKTQVRSAYVHLVIALAECNDKSVHRFVLKEGSLVSSLLRAIDCDSVHLLSFLFDKLSKLVLSNENVDENTKWSLFNSQSVERIVKLLLSASDAVARCALRFLKGLFLSEGSLFRLPRETSVQLLLSVQGDENTTTATSVSSKMLTFVVKSTGLAEVFASAPLEQFLSGLFVRYPALLVVYLKNLSLSLEPRLSYRWFSVASFVSKLLCLPNQANLAEFSRHTPSNILAQLVVPRSARKELTRGIQHTSPLVVYTTLGVLQAYFKRFELVGKVAGRSHELEQAVRCEFPSPDALIGLLMRLCGSFLSVAESGLLYARALNVFRLYFQNYSERVTTEVKVDLSKLCRWELLAAETPKSDPRVARLTHLILGEMMLLLSSVEPKRLLFLLPGDGKPLEQTKLFSICRLYTTSGDRDLQLLCKQVIERILVVTGVFGVPQECQDVHEQAVLDEIAIWSDNLRFCDDSGVLFFLRVLDATLRDPLTNIMKFQETTVPLSPAVLTLLCTFEEADHTVDGVVTSFVIRTLFCVLLKCPNPLEALRMFSSRTSKDDESANGSSRKRRRVECVAVNPWDSFKMFWSSILANSNESQRQSIAFDLNRPSAKTPRTVQLKVHTILNCSERDFLTLLDEILRQCALPLPQPEADGDSFDLIFQYLATHFALDVFSHPQLAKLLKNQKVAAHWSQFVDKMPLHLLAQCTLLPISSAAKADTRQSFDRVKFIESTVKKRCEVGQVTVSEAVAASELLCVLLSSDRYRLEHSALADVVHKLVVFVNVSNPVQSLILFEKTLTILLQSPSAGAKHLETVIVCSLSWRCLSNRPLSSSWKHVMRRLSFPSLLVVTPHLALEVQSRFLSCSLVSSSRSSQLLVERVLDSVAWSQSGNHCSALSASLGSSNVAQLWAFLKSSLLCRKINSSGRGLLVVLHALMLVNRAGGVLLPSDNDIQESVVPFLVRLLQQLGCTSRVAQFLEEFLKCFRSKSVNKRLLGEMLFEACSAHADIQANKEAQLFLLCAWDSAVRLDFSRLKNDKLPLGVFGDARDLMGNKKTRHKMVAFLTNFLRSPAEIAEDRLRNKTKYLAVLVTKLVSQGEEESPSQESMEQLLLLLLVCLRNGLSIPAFHRPEIVSFLLRGVIGMVNNSSTRTRVPKLVQMVCVVLKGLQITNVSIPSTISKNLRRIMDNSTSKSIDVVAEISCLLLQVLESEDDDAEQAGEHLQTLVNHPEFDELLTSHSKSRLRLLRLILRLVVKTGKKPFVCARALHVKLLHAYSCSMTRADRLIKAILDLNVQKENSSVSNQKFGFRFGSSVTSSLLEDSVHVTSESLWFVNDAVTTDRIRATIDFFPMHSPVLTTSEVIFRLIDEDDDDDDDEDATNSEDAGRAFDPGFFLPLLAHLISSSDLRDSQLVQLGLVGIAIRGTSSTCLCVRKHAYGILAQMHESLSGESTDLKANRQIFLVLETLRNAIGDPYAALPSIITVFLNDVISILTRPTHLMFAQVNHFLLARPAIDLKDVPMFYTLFNSHSPLSYKQERSWFLHFLRRSIVTDSDVDLLTHRHVLEILLSFFSSELADEHTQELILRVLIACAKTGRGFWLLVLRMGSIEWLAQLYLRELSPKIVQSALSLHIEFLQHLPLMTGGQRGPPTIQVLNALNALLRWRDIQKCCDEAAAKNIEQIACMSVGVVGSSQCSLAMMETVIKSVQPNGALNISLIDAMIGFQPQEGALAMAITSHPDLSIESIPRWAWVVRQIWEALDVAIRIGGDVKARDVAAALRTWVQQTPSLHRALLHDNHGQHRAFASFM